MGVAQKDALSLTVGLDSVDEIDCGSIATPLEGRNGASDRPALDHHFVPDLRLGVRVDRGNGRFH